MNTTYTAGQAVQIHVTDFTVAGMPSVWVDGIVEEVLPIEDTKLVDVKVRQASGLLSVFRVGPRGGNKDIRVSA